MTTTRTAYIATALIASGLAMPWASALADSNWKQSSAKWSLMDRCTRAARKQYPDHTAEANAQREASRRQCLRTNNLPADDPQEPEPQPAPDRH